MIATKNAADLASTSLAASRATDLRRNGHRVDGACVAPLDVQSSYDGSNVVFRLLRLESWGPSLMNLGYYRYPRALAFVNLITSMEKAQRRLAVKAIDLLDVRGGHRVFDVACGRGKSSFLVKCLHSDATVVGLDLLDDNVQVARVLFDQVRNLSYATGNAMALDFADESFDRVMCIEAAFHFPDRARFLREASRVLRPGGRLVVVDFAWNTDADRARRDDPETRAVRDVWQWDNLSSVPEYERSADASGFRLLSSHDWSPRVTHRIQWMFQFVSTLGNTPWGRRLLLRKNRLYQSLSNDDWKQLAVAVRANQHVVRHSKYMAFVLEKR